MSGTTECQCPQKPCFTLGSFGSGSEYEARAEREWELEHGDHANAAIARLPPVTLWSDQLAAYRDELRQHLAKNGDTLMQIAPHHFRALLDAAGDYFRLNTKPQDKETP